MIPFSPGAFAESYFSVTPGYEEQQNTYAGVNYANEIMSFVPSEPSIYDSTTGYRVATEENMFCTPMTVSNISGSYMMISFPPDDTDMTGGQNFLQHTVPMFNTPAIFQGNYAPICNQYQQGRTIIMIERRIVSTSITQNGLNESLDNNMDMHTSPTGGETYYVYEDSPVECDHKMSENESGMNAESINTTNEATTQTLPDSVKDDELNFYGTSLAECNTEFVDLENTDAEFQDTIRENEVTTQTSPHADDTLSVHDEISSPEQCEEQYLADENNYYDESHDVETAAQMSSDLNSPSFYKTPSTACDNEVNHYVSENSSDSCDDIVNEAATQTTPIPEDEASFQDIPSVQSVGDINELEIPDDQESLGVTNEVTTETSSVTDSTTSFSQSSVIQYSGGFNEFEIPNDCQNLSNANEATAQTSATDDSFSYKLQNSMDQTLNFELKLDHKSMGGKNGFSAYSFFDTESVQSLNISESEVFSTAEAFGSESSDAVACGHCNELFDNIDYLEQHMIIHMDIDDKRYQCSICEKTFSTSTYLQIHKQTHKNPDMFKCKDCSMCFKTKITLLRHTINHKEPEKFKCEICNQVFKTVSYLNTHKSLHNNPHSNKCVKCGKRFSSRWSLGQHMKLHSDDSKFKCNFCGKFFSTDAYLKSHMFIHTEPEKLICSICDKYFKSDISMKNHVLTIHKNVTRWKCNICTSSFTNSGNLRTHMNSHYGDLRAKCNLCNRILKNKYALKRHMSTHLNKTYMNCDICKQTFKHGKRFKVHMLNHSTGKQSNVSQKV